MTIVPVPEQVFNQHTFASVYRTDLDNSCAYSFMESGFLTVDGLSRFASSIKESVRRGVRNCLFTREPDDWDMLSHPNCDPHRRAQLKKLQAAINLGHELGAHVTLRPGDHLKLSVIDYKTTWGGSLNILSYTHRTDEEAWRWTDKVWALDTIRRRKYESCKQCLQLLAERENLEVIRMQNALGVDRHVLGKQIANARKSAGMTQEQLADVLGVSRDKISKIELGLRVPDTDLTVRIFTLFDKQLLIAPKDVAPILVRWLNLLN